MAATSSIKFRFQSEYRGGTKIWSTTFHVTGGDWQDQTHFNTFSDNAEGEIRSATYPATTIVDSTGYNGGSSLPVFTKSYNVAGTSTFGGSSYPPLETALLLKWTTDQRSTKNHPIYLFNYIHGVPIDASSTPEVPVANSISHWNTRIADWIAGYSDGTLTRHRAGPRGAVAQSGSCHTYFTHRDFPR